MKLWEALKEMEIGYRICAKSGDSVLMEFDKNSIPDKISLLDAVGLAWDVNDAVILMSCPFCGGDPAMKTDHIMGVEHFVACPKCDISTLRYRLGREAAAVWNRRAYTSKHPDTKEPTE